MELPDHGQELTQPKRKRGRPPKVRYPIPSDAEFPASHLTDDTAIKELQLAYKPLKEIMGISKLRPLVDKPDELLYGLYDYYDIIEKPMWFLEITRKYAEKEYKNAVEVMEDVRLVLENCYRFWGKKHKFVKQALRAEKIVAKHIVGFPPEVKAKCCLTLYDTEDALATDQGSDAQHSYMTDEYTSKILQNLEKKPITTKMGATVEEMQKWEDDVLQGKQHNRQINLVSELAEVGQFLVMAREILCLKPISQYEIERMLLIPRESSTLATIMTSFLCPTAMRTALYFKPIMIYDVWASLLQKKLDTWYNAYTKYNNRIQVFLKYGVEPSFFNTVGDVNPLLEASFHELSLLKKASILKALCSNMFHSNKKIEDYFNLVDESSLKSRLLYSDSKYDYVSLFSPEIRVYRSSRICLDIDETIEAVYPSYFNYYPRVEVHAQEELHGGSFSRKQKFCLIANDTEGLTNLSKLCAKKRRSRVAINRLLVEEKNRELCIIGLRALYSQWNKAIFKDPASVEISKNYWIAKVVNNPSIVDAEAGDVALPENPCKTEAISPTPNRELGKRIMKRKYPINDHEDSFSSNDDKPNEEDVSDWEDGNIRRSRRIKKVSGLPRFFDHKYMKFDDATEGEYVYGSNYWKNSPEEKAALKKPRKKRTPKEASDSPKERQNKRVSKAEKTATKKVLLRMGGNCGVQTAERTMFGDLSLPVIKEEPYMPPIEVPKLPQPPQFGKDSKLAQFSPRFGDPGKSDLLSDLSVWDFGLTGFPAFAPLKPVDDACLPEDGDRKLLELGAFKKVEAPIKVESDIDIKPTKIELQRALAPPVKRNRVSFQHLTPMNKPSSMMVVPSKKKERLESLPGPSKILNRVFLPRQDMRGPRLIAGVIPADPRDTMFLKTGLTRVKLPVHHVPQQNLMIKRKVHLPARPLSIPIVKNQQIPVFENTTWAKHSHSERTVLYIPSGTPTITIPSASGSKEVGSLQERTLTVL